MSWRTPSFWYDRYPVGEAVSLSLLPLSLLWRFGGAVRRQRARPDTLPLPLVTVGNLTAGGTGKTPMTAHLAAMATKLGCTPVVLSRGYGGRIKHPHQVQPDDRAEEVGDEALELSRFAPVVIAAERGTGARFIIDAGLGGLIIMDDGFQNPSIAPSRSVLMFDGARGVGNGRLIPSGPMREPLGAGLARASHALIMGDDATGLGDRIRRLAPHIHLAMAQKRLDQSAIPDAPLMAFAGIGNPASFFNLIEQHGGRIVRRRRFNDHHRYSRAEINALISEAEKENLRLVTTMKDFTRIPNAENQPITPLAMSLEIDPAFCRGLIMGDDERVG